MGGRERAWMGEMCRELTEAVIRLRLPWERKREIALGWTHDHERVMGTMLNTVCSMGSRPLRLAAHIHGRCETNTVIDGAAFAEVAQALEDGLQLGVFREETQGYEGIRRIIARLREGGPWCVWSYSVTDGFPRWDYDRNASLGDEATVALLRAEDNTLDVGDLDRSQPFHGESFWTMGPEDMANLVCGPRR